jgi:hypothetical protein
VWGWNSNITNVEGNLGFCVLTVDVSVLVASVVAGFYRMDLFRKSGGGDSSKIRLLW